MATKTRTARTRTVKKQASKTNGGVIREDGPIIIKGGSVSVRYKRSSFRPRGEWNDHVDNGQGSAMVITQVTVMNDDTGVVLYQGAPGRNCTIEIDYE